MIQLSIFDCKPPVKVNKPIRLIELFAGIGSQAKALKNIGANFEHYRVCEFDKYAVASYNAVHGTNFTTSDIRALTAEDLGIKETDKYFYIMTYSFPCQDLSLAGKQRGMEKGSQTRSSLLWEVERLLDDLSYRGGRQSLPQMLLMENVPNVHGKKNIENFNAWIGKLESLGYSNFWKDLNSKDFGVPQDRNRCFMVSLLDDCSYHFPSGFPLEIGLKDVLEQEVDEKYYISEEQAKRIRASTFTERRSLIVPVPSTGGGTDAHANRARVPRNNLCRTIRAGGRSSFDGKHSWDIVEIIEMVEVIQKGRGKNEGFCEERETCPTITSSFFEQNTLVSPHTKKVKVFQYPRGYNPGGEIGNECYPTVRQDNTERYTNAVWQEGDSRIRRLTPKETWRLMGFADEDFEKASKVNSNTQLYKQAGNSIVVPVLEAIFKQLFQGDQQK